MKKTLLVGACILGLGTAMTSFADDNMYVGAKGGFYFTSQNNDRTLSNVAVGPTGAPLTPVDGNLAGSLDFKNTWNAGVSFGYKINEFFRTELEYMHYGSSEVEQRLSGNLHVVGNRATQVLGKTDFSADTFMWNNYVSVLPLFNLDSDKDIDLYAGLGLGVSVNRTTNLDATATIAGLGSVSGSCGGYKNNAFAYQATAGVLYNLTSNMKLDAYVRYANLGSLDSKNISMSGSVGGIDSNTATGELNSLRLSNVSVGLGITYAL